MEVALEVGAVHRTAKEDACLAEAVHSVDRFNATSAIPRE